MNKMTTLLAALIGIGSFASAAERPNVVMIISDDQTATDFGFMGHKQVRTPHLDRLAANSARFINGYVPSSVCRPSLVTLLTGLYPHQHGVHFNHPPPGFAKLTRSPDIQKAKYDELRNRATSLVRSVPTLPRILASNGYRCLQTGKYWEGHWKNAGFTAGMTIAEPSSDSGALGNKRIANGDVVAHGNGDHGLTIGRETMQPIYDFVDDCKENGDPFFVWYAPFLPHLPHDAPDRFRKLYEDDSTVPQHAIPYFAACSWFDETVGQLLQHLNDTGLADDTIIVFVIDNGFTPDAKQPLADGDFNYTKTSKRSPFEDGLRTPILIRWAGHTQSLTHVSLCSSVDILPTLLSAMDINVAEADLPGRTLWPAAIGKKPLVNRAVFGEIYPGDATTLGNPERDVAYRWIRAGRFKLIVPHLQSQKKPWGKYLTQPTLFDLVADPHEKNNLANDEDFAQTKQQLTRKLDDWWSGRESASNQVPKE